MVRLWEGVRWWGKDTASREAHHSTAWVGLFLFEVIVVLLGPVLWGIGGWDLIADKTRLALDAFDAISEHDQKVEAYGKLVSTIGLLAATPIGMFGVGLAFWRTWNQHRDGNTALRNVEIAEQKLDTEAYAKAAEAFAKAVEQLGSDKASIRMGAVFALEALGKSTPRLLSQAIELLCAYVREMKPRSHLPAPGEVEMKHNSKERAAPHPSDTETQLILDIILRLKDEDKNNEIKIDFSNTDLNGAKFYKGNLNKADFRKTNLINANFREANLSETNLSEADLSKANLCMSNLSRASLLRANLSEANLVGANLSEIDLSSTNLLKADLRRANLFGSRLPTFRLDAATFEDTTLPDGTIWTGKGPPPDYDINPDTAAPMP